MVIVRTRAVLNNKQAASLTRLHLSCDPDAVNTKSEYHRRFDNRDRGGGSDLVGLSAVQEQDTEGKNST